mmetsp:Transcript_5686/g.35376  ORF Transcript_5686/g.35376 Transcript_5686/m.35376 type:complete len:149 (-) Transcript_5686:2171-2617(-)
MPCCTKILLQTVPFTKVCFGRRMSHNIFYGRMASICRWWLRSQPTGRLVNSSSKAVAAASEGWKGFSVQTILSYSHAILSEFFGGMEIHNKDLSTNKHLKNPESLRCKCFVSSCIGLLSEQIRSGLPMKATTCRLIKQCGFGSFKLLA